MNELTFMKNKIINFLKPFNKLLIHIYEIESLISRKWVSSAHKRLFSTTWSRWSSPEFFDHHIDLFYKWINTRESFWIERGVYNSLALKKGGTLLELACGDGFNARNFYSGLVNKVVACDFDKTAISLAKRKNSAPNISFILADIRTDMPEGIYDNITWDAAIEHFTQDEILLLMKTIKSRLSPNGILSGYTIVEGSHGKAVFLEQYIHE